MPAEKGRSKGDSRVFLPILKGQWNPKCERVDTYGIQAIFTVIWI